MRKIGYARVSTSSQNLDRQIAALRSAGVDEIYREKASGKDTKGRPQLEKAIDALGTGDVLVVAEWDRATRSMLDGIAIIERIHARGSFVKVLDKPHLDLTTPLGRGLIALLSAMAEDERQRIVKRARDGLDAAKARGAKSAASRSSPTIRGPRHGGASMRAKALGRSASPTWCTTRQCRGFGVRKRRANTSADIS